MPAGHLGRRPVGVEPVGLGLHVGLGHRVGGCGRAAARRVELHEAVGCLGVAGGAAQRESALGAGGGHGDRPARTHLAQHLVLGDLDVVEEDLGETGLAVDLGDGTHGDAGRVHGDQEIGQPAMALGVGVGAEDAEAPVGEGAPAGPGLLPVEDPAAVVRRVACGARADAGEVAAGVGLGPALAPDLVAGRHRREIAGLLGLGPVLEHGGGEQEDAVLAHPLGGPGPVVLLLEDEPLEEPEVAAAVLDRPADHGPAVLEHRVLPGPVGLEAVGRIERGEGVGRDVRSSQARASARKASFSGEKVRSTARESGTAAAGLPRCGAPERVLSRGSSRRPGLPWSARPGSSRSTRRAAS